MRFRKIAIVGLGLLGGSIGQAAKKRRLAREIAAYVRRNASIADCEKAGAADYATTDLLAAISGADLVVLCTPLSQMPALARRMIPALKRGAIITDVGSVKRSVIRDLEGLTHRAGAHFIGSHPMAGAEKSGVAAARAGLFEGAVCVVTPTRQSNRSALGTVERFWKDLGAQVLRLAPERHDLLVSRSSHLPHLVAATLANLVLRPAASREQPALCANGFRDTTRIASGSPEMWRDIALANRKNLERAIGRFISDLEGLRRMLRRSDAAGVEQFFELAKRRRDAWSSRCSSSSPE